MNMATKVSYETQWNFLTGNFEDNALTSLTYMANGFVFCQLGKKTNDIMIIMKRFQTSRSCWVKKYTFGILEALYQWNRAAVVMCKILRKFAAKSGIKYILLVSCWLIQEKFKCYQSWRGQIWECFSFGPKVRKFKYFPHKIFLYFDMLWNF